MKTQQVAIYGAYGHTGRFIVARLYEKGWRPILCGRNVAKLSALNAEYPDLESRVADTSNPTSLDQAFINTSLVVNCAGPFLDTALPIIESALRLSIHYIDVSAEQKSVMDVFEKFGEHKGPNVILPAMAFYGGLADLLSTAITTGWETIDQITIAIGLSSWHPTEGTRLTGQRNHYPRMIYANGRLTPKSASASTKYWDFPEPFGSMQMIDLPFSEIITISKHLDAQNIFTYLSLNSVNDIRNKDVPTPTPIDEKGRSGQEFCVEVLVKKAGEKRTIRATGRDIYAVTAPLVVEAISRLENGNHKTTGVTAPGQLFDAVDFLNAISSEDIQLFFPVT